MHDDDEEKPSGAIKITDRRRFDSSGNVRANEFATSESPAKATSPSKASSNGANVTPPKPAAASPNSAAQHNNIKPEGQESRDSHEELESEINFSSFVVSLATQALMQMGQMSPPPGVNIEQDLVAAKQTIDILQMLQSKTRNNLSAKENEMLSEILHSLKMGFVRSRGGQVGK